MFILFSKVVACGCVFSLGSTKERLNGKDDQADERVRKRMED
jgi:hypothetical protein